MWLSQHRGHLGLLTETATRKSYMAYATFTLYIIINYLRIPYYAFFMVFKESSEYKQQ